jgi:hypothetical protein
MSFDLILMGSHSHIPCIFSQRPPWREPLFAFHELKTLDLFLSLDNFS